MYYTYIYIQGVELKGIDGYDFIPMSYGMSKGSFLCKSLTGEICGYLWLGAVGGDTFLTNERNTMKKQESKGFSFQKRKSLLVRVLSWERSRSCCRVSKSTMDPC